MDNISLFIIIGGAFAVVMILYAILYIHLKKTGDNKNILFGAVYGFFNKDSRYAVNHTPTNTIEVENLSESNNNKNITEFTSPEFTQDNNKPFTARKKHYAPLLNRKLMKK